MKRERERKKKKESSVELLTNLVDDDIPLVFPDELITYDLKRAGFQSKDKRIVRLVSLAAQKFLGDMCDSFDYEYKLQQSKKGGEKRTLTMDIVSSALREYGINVRKPKYYSDRSGKPTQPRN